MNPNDQPTSPRPLHGTPPFKCDQVRPCPQAHAETTRSTSTPTVQQVRARLRGTRSPWPLTLINEDRHAA